MAGAAASFGMASFGMAFGAGQARSAARDADLMAQTPDGWVQVTALSDRAVRVRITPKREARAPLSAILAPRVAPPKTRRAAAAQGMSLHLPHLRCDWDASQGVLSFYDADGVLLLHEAAGTRRLTPTSVQSEEALIVEQGFESPADERLFGTGCFQDGHLNLRGLPRRLTQVNTQISQPVVLSSKGYALLWHNTGLSELNPPQLSLDLQKRAVGDAQTADVTTTKGNARVERRSATFDGVFDLATAGDVAFLYDCGRKMASRYHIEIDGQVVVDHANLWLPPTTSFIAHLSAGAHQVRIEADAADAPVLRYGPCADGTLWRSAVADAIDYVVIAGPDPKACLSGFRDLIGETPLPPVWAFGYIHCRERFHSSDEILSIAREFRARRLPVDVMVQDWQYWGKYGWNAMRFDEASYPDPAVMITALHGMDMRFMLSVWSKIGRETELGKVFAAKGFYIPDTEWVDFFNPTAASFYADCQNRRLAALGVDAWWQDATEPENDDLVGRRTFAGPGERVRLTYPVQVSRTVYNSQRIAHPDKRVMILTRSAFPGEQRYGAATWSGDIGNDWETLKRQIPAGLNMAAAGYPYWTVDAGGFFRPGDGQYHDPAYHERLVRWLQYATFLPLQRVHGYQTDTEFWRYGDQVETLARRYLELRYRLLPYTYSLAAQMTREGMPLIRPLVMDFAHDPQALEQTHAYMYGPALHVAPVLAPGVETWRVYLPQSAGGWRDFWTGAHREGGAWHEVEASLERIPLHVRAGGVLPLGPVVQSTAGALHRDLDLCVYPGRDGQFDLYEDDGLSYAYEKGAGDVISLRWDETARSLRIGGRTGGFKGADRRLKLRLMGKGDAALAASSGQELVYRGAPLKARL
jgi:alpha-D-xyloside xylohydrolase